MLITIFISSAIMLFLMMLGLGLKMVFHPRSGFSVHSCGIENNQKGTNEVCATCGLSNLIDCSEEKAKAS